MTFLKVVTPKGEVMWVNTAVIYYIASYKGRFRIYFEDGMSCDAVEIGHAPLEEFLHSMLEN